MEKTLSFYSPFPSCQPNHSLKKISIFPFSSYRASNPTVSIPSKSSKKSRETNPRIAPPNSERNQWKKTHKLNVEVSPHRAVAAVRLLRIEQGGAFADLLNDKGRNSMRNEMDYVERTLGFRTRDLDDRDIRLVTDVVGGAVRWRRYLDHLIMSLCNEERMFREMEPLLLQILRIGFYEIIKLGMPSYAVVDENVRLAKVALRPGAGNMVNGILRKLVLLKDKDSLPLPKLEGDDRSQARVLAIIYSHPVWMVRRWTKFFGQEEAVRLMNWNNSDPRFSLRVNTGRGYTRTDLVAQLKTLKVPHELSMCMDDFVHIQTGLQIIIQAGLLKEGLCSVQDESAGLVVSVVDPQPGETIIDCCAAPGGKTLFMASRLRGQGMILAIDINKGRLRILKEASKLHNVNAVVTSIHADLRSFAENNAVKCDKVLLDAPCSGLGVLSKRADLRWNRRLEDLEQLTHLQDELLDAAAMLVQPGGILVYSTCSIDPQENEERIDAFLHRHPFLKDGDDNVQFSQAHPRKLAQEFVVDPVDGRVPPDFVTDKGFYFSNPIKHSIDGSFAARLIRSLDHPDIVHPENQLSSDEVFPVTCGLKGAFCCLEAIEYIAGSPMNSGMRRNGAHGSKSP